MAYTVRIHLNNINDSASVGDTVYYTSKQTIDGGVNFFIENKFTVNQNNYADIVKIGTIKRINHRNAFVDVEGDANVDMPNKNHYVFFSKDNLINQGFIKGYYAELKMVNTDYYNKSELFRISLAADESSK